MGRTVVWAAILLSAGCGDNLEPIETVRLVGHSDLWARGMNAAPAIAGDTMYVGSRTDGAFRDNTRVLIVDIADPANPTVVDEIADPDHGLIGISSRELRTVPDKDLLIVMSFSCSFDLHACRTSPSFAALGGVEETDNLRFYDISDPHSPQLIARYDFGSSPVDPFVGPHEFFLWRDPNDSDRVLLYISTPPGPPAFEILDISDPTDVKMVATFDPEQDAGLDEPRGPDTILHSAGVTADGTIGLFSYLNAGLLLVDTSDVAAGAADPQLSLLHDVSARVDWSPPEPAGPHSAVEVPGRDLLVATDEVYPQGYGAGCPWGWMHMVDIADPSAPKLVGEYKLPENGGDLCLPEGGPERITYTAHNATATENLAIITWHAGGVQFVDITDPRKPRQVGQFLPEPIPGVATEDPALGGVPITMWSYPIIKDGLIYVIDIRNGLYVLEYNGPFVEQVRDLDFAEGNSNL